MEAQHGIFVERAKSIHSFSHLTLQEYFAARYIVENENRGAVENLIAYLGDDRWQEVFLLTAGMLDDATKLCELILHFANQIIVDDNHLVDLLKLLERKGQQIQTPYSNAAKRSFLWQFALTYIQEDSNDIDDYRTFMDLNLNLSAWFGNDIYFEFSKSQQGIEVPLEMAILLDDNLKQTILLVLINEVFLFHEPEASDMSKYALDVAIKIAKHVRADQMLNDLSKVNPPDEEFEFVDYYPDINGAHPVNKILEIIHANLDQWDPYLRIRIGRNEVLPFRNLSKEQQEKLQKYLQVNLLLAKCLKVAYVPNRRAIENRILLPPSS
jgi:hypothetical protein